MTPNNRLIFQYTIPGIYAEEQSFYPDYSMAKRHLHSSTEIYFMFKGERYYFIEQDTFHVKPYMAVLINPHLIHKTHTVNHGGYHRFLLQLDKSILDMFAKISDNYDLITKPYDVVEFTKEDWEKVIPIIERLKKEMGSEKDDDHTMSRLLAMQLVTLFARAQKKQHTSAQMQPIPDRIVHASKYELVHEIILYIQEHLAEECTLDGIAAHFYISRAYLTRVFKFITGFTVKEYLNLCRIRNAKTLLQTTNLSITEIATRTGFGNITNFEKNFKNMTSLTPLQYRKQK